ncbi:MAG: hypothetical protein BucCj_2170 [Buchnera aphidicola (Ceratovacuna japonica)]
MNNINNEINIIKLSNINKVEKKNSNIIKEKMEEIFIKILLRNIRITTPKNKLFNEKNNEIYNEIYDQKLSEIMSKRGINFIQTK